MFPIQSIEINLSHFDPINRIILLTVTPLSGFHCSLNTNFHTLDTVEDQTDHINQMITITKYVSYPKY
jgi:hypothetical protein